ncbi:MAG: RDD family protein [Ahrensia sp.]|nr:RDD family protein [Ahrensia sp.]
MNTTTIDNQTGQEVVPASALDGVRRGRIFAFLVDYLIVMLLCIPAAIIVFVLGIPTLGLAWGLFPFLIPAIAIAYVAITMGGEAQATIGMRMNGLRVNKLGGGRVDPFLAGMHHLLFLVIQTFGVLLPLLITFFSSKKRLLHDILLGTYVTRS